ncbi:MAG: twin-arginine translocase subunit TatC [Ignavibacteria bacterium]|nr:twin-arginine translocase subunit TatC [Ignavibacteria bacterium]
MSFLEHLEELRWRIIKAVIGIVIGGILVAIFIDPIINDVIFLPAKNTDPPMTIINLKPFGQFTLYMEVILIGGIVVSIPNILFQIWKFIAPALKPGESKYITAIVFFSSFCFLAGIAFAYFIMLPTALNFFVDFGTEFIDNKIAANEYMRFVISLCIAAGIVFELPMVSFFLSKIGILKPSFMRKYRKHAIVIILILAGILTPSPDITSQLLLGVPLFLLYEISIFICKYSQKKKDISSEIKAA